MVPDDHNSSHYGQLALFASTGSREDLQEKEKVSLPTGKKQYQMIWLFSFLGFILSNHVIIQAKMRIALMIYIQLKSTQTIPISDPAKGS